MATRKLTLCCLYPGILSACGDRGNLAAIVRRCGWRGIGTEVRELRHGDPVRPDEADIILIGDGEDLHRRLIAQDLADVKGPGLREAAGQGAAVLAVGAGYQLLGRFYQPARGAELPGAGVFDAWTIEPALGPGAVPGPEAVPGPGAVPGAAAAADRVTGDLLIRWGAQAGAAVGTYLRGPCLPWNPALADFLIGAALGRRYGEAGLEPLPDDLERAAHDTAVRRIHVADAAALADAQA